MSIADLRSAVTTAGATPAAYDEVTLLRQLITAKGGTPTQYSVNGLLREAITAWGGTPTQYAYMPLLRQFVTALGGSPASYNPDMLWAQIAPLAISFTVSGLFAGTAGGWYDPSDLSSMFQDTAGTVPVAADGDPVGRINDKSGNGKHLLQATAGARPLYKTLGGLSWLFFDGIDDRLVVTMGAMPQPSTMFAAYRINTTGTGGDIMDAADAVPTASHRNMLGIRSGQVVGYAGTVVNIGAENTSDHVARVQFGATDALQLDNGAVVTTDTGVGAPLATDLFVVGSSTVTTEFAPVRVYGAVYINRALTAGETNSLRTYLGAKAGLVL